MGTDTVSNVNSNGTPHPKLSEVVDVVIIGAGPTGLLSALLATHLGLSVCILDSKDGPLEVGGADAITARTQQYLEIVSNFERRSGANVGLLEDLLKNGIKCNTSTTYADGQFTSRQSHWWNGISHTFYNNLLMIGQPFIERLLASKIDVKIHYSEPAIKLSYNTSPSGVVIETAKRLIHGRYCIAADGARSFVRNELKIGWEGTKPNMIWTVMDCWIETTFPMGKEIVTLQINGESRMAWIPRERGMQRFYLLLDGDTSQEKALASIREHMAPHTVDITHVEWLSRFEIKERVASTFLYPSDQGPFILAGDAAHVHAVNGGQGMNTGLSDAFNLIWHTLNALTRSYDIERRATAKEVVEVAADLVRSTKTTAKHYVELIEKNAGFITGMGVNYAGLESPLVQTSKHSVFEAGYRCPDLWLQDNQTGAWCRLYEKLQYGRFILLNVGKSIPIKEHSAFSMVLHLSPLPKSCAAASRINEEEVGNLIEQRIFSCPSIREGETHTVVVRPDTYIAYIGDQLEVKQYCDSLFPHLNT